MELSREIKIAPIKVNGSRTELNVIEIEVSHDKGGYNMFTGESRRTGIICSIRPMGRHDGCCSTIIDGKTEHMGFYTFLVPCGRKSPKKLEMVANEILPLSEKIAEMFLEGQYQAIANMMTSAVRAINL